MLLSAGSGKPRFLTAAKGDWGARRLLQRRVTRSLGSAARGLVSWFGSRTAAAAHVKTHFDQRFQNVSEDPVFFEGLDDLEPDFSETEIVAGVRKLKSNKTTGPSRDSAELLAPF